MRVALVGPYFFPQVYGIEKVMYKHAIHLAALGHEVDVLTSSLKYPAGRYADLPRREEREGITIWRLPVFVRSLGRAVAYPSRGGMVVLGLRRGLRAIDPDIVHAHNAGAPAWADGAARFARRRGRPFFYSPYMHPMDLRLARPRKALLRALNRVPTVYAHAILHQTRVDFEIFGHEFPWVDWGKFDVLPNGVDPPRAAGASRSAASRLEVLFVGRVDDPRKGFDHLADAWREVAPRLPDARLTVLGAVSEARAQTLRRDHGERIRVLGLVPEDRLEQAYAEADVLVMPSLYEGFGMPSLEAMRYGVPVVATAVGGLAEVVPPDAGVLVSPGSSAALAAGIMEMTDPARRRAAGAKGREWARHYEWPRLVAGLVERYEEVARRLG